MEDQSIALMKVREGVLLANQTIALQVLRLAQADDYPLHRLFGGVPHPAITDLAERNSAR